MRYGLAGERKPEMMSPAIPGLRYVSDYLDPEDHDRLLAAANSQRWQRTGSRGVQIYGYSYNHAKGGIYRVDDLPEWVAGLAERLKRDGLMPSVPDQLVANEYQAGAGIFSHLDAPVFDDTIVSVSVGSPCVMQSTECDARRLKEMLVEPRSALIFAGEARHRWKHGIPARSQDVWLDQVVSRGTRVSLTFRKMLRTSGLSSTG
jgi:alkylated DNA repair dioxygenase AlkB